MLLPVPGMYVFFTRVQKYCYQYVFFNRIQKHLFLASRYQVFLFLAASQL